MKNYIIYCIIFFIGNCLYVFAQETSDLSSLIENKFTEWTEEDFKA